MSRQGQATISKFLEVTGTSSQEVAIFFLNRNQNKITQSINDFYTNSNLVRQITNQSNSNEEKAIDVNPRLQALFDKYKDPQLDGLGKTFIGIDGTLQYLEDLGYDPEDIAVLPLAEFLQAPSVGVFKQDLFLKNWTKVGCNTIEEQRAFSDALRKKLYKDDEYFKKVYLFVYKFILEPKAKTLPYDVAVEYWRLVLPSTYEEEMNLFCEFIEEHYQKNITNDQWNMLLPFLDVFYNDSKLKNYDENQSWPVLMDEFVEWLEENEKYP